MCVHFLYEIYLLLYEMPNHFFPNSVFIYVDGLHNSSHGDSLPMLISNVCGIPVADRLLIRAIQILTPAILLEMIMRTVPPDFCVLVWMIAAYLRIVEIILAYSLTKCKGIYYFLIYQSFIELFQRTLFTHLILKIKVTD